MLRFKDWACTSRWFETIEIIGSVVERMWVRGDRFSPQRRRRWGGQLLNLESFMVEYTRSITNHCTGTHVRLSVELQRLSPSGEFNC